jgi:Na+-transporting methylmalonyl-CoA/oxaloacetate decarboxylase gamma subunit
MGGFSESSSNMGTGETITFVIIGLVILGFAIWGITSMVNGQNNSEENDQKAEEKYESELTDYKVALIAWNALYYCHKHDIVFMLGNNDYAPKEDMWKACIRWGKDKAASS